MSNNGRDRNDDTQTRLVLQVIESSRENPDRPPVPMAVQQEVEPWDRKKAALYARLEVIAHRLKTALRKLADDDEG